MEIHTIDAEPQELDTYTLNEGGFFGNFFADQSVAYCCTGSRSGDFSSIPALQTRRCTEASGHTTPDGQQMTLCGFIDTGVCPEFGHISVNGLEWREIMHIYLNPVAGFSD